MGNPPLKESRNIELYRSMFKWKYPLWYSHNIKMEDFVLFEMGRAGIWYTENISMKNCIVEAPKNSLAVPPESNWSALPCRMQVRPCGTAIRSGWTRYPRKAIILQ